LIARADTGLYDAKRTGRNRTSIVLAAAAPRYRATDQRARVTTEPTRAATHDGRGESPSAVRAGGWDGVERRDPNRRDRRGIPGPGRRATDGVVAGRWRDH
jgi:hypothetical protein